MRQRGILGAVILAATLVLAAAVVSMFAARPNPAAELEQQVLFPAVWTPTAPDDDVVWRDAEVTLEAGGAAQLTKAPGGQIQQIGGTLCVARTGELFTGTAEWTVRAEGYVDLSYEGGSLAFVPDTGKLGSLDWIDISVPFCGDEEAATFGLRSDLKSNVD